MELLKVDTEVSITLKDLTDLIGVRHNDAMKKVYELSLEDGFGLLRETRISHIKGKEITTYLLNSKQAIAAGARLNNSLLMKVINKIEELQKELAPQKSMVSKEIILLAQGYQVVDERLTLLEQTKRLEAWQERALIDAKNKKVYSFNPSDAENTSKLHRAVWSHFKKRFNLPRYNELPAIKFEDGLSFINSITLIDLV